MINSRSRESSQVGQAEEGEGEGETTHGAVKGWETRRPMGGGEGLGDETAKSTQKLQFKRDLRGGGGRDRPNSTRARMRFSLVCLFVSYAQLMTSRRA